MIVTYRYKLLSFVIQNNKSTNECIFCRSNCKVISCFQVSYLIVNDSLNEKGTDCNVISEDETQIDDVISTSTNKYPRDKDKLLDDNGDATPPK